MKSCASPLCPIQEANHPLVQHIHVVPATHHESPSQPGYQVGCCGIAVLVFGGNPYFT